MTYFGAYSVIQTPQVPSGERAGALKLTDRHVLLVKSYLRSICNRLRYTVPFKNIRPLGFLNFFRSRVNFFR